MKQPKYYRGDRLKILTRVFSDPQIASGETVIVTELPLKKRGGWEYIVSGDKGQIVQVSEQLLSVQDKT